MSSIVEFTLVCQPTPSHELSQFLHLKNPLFFICSAFIFPFLGIFHVPQKLTKILFQNMYNIVVVFFFLNWIPALTSVFSLSNFLCLSLFPFVSPNFSSSKFPFICFPSLTQSSVEALMSLGIDSLCSQFMLFFPPVSFPFLLALWMGWTHRVQSHPPANTVTSVSLPRMTDSHRLSLSMWISLSSSFPSPNPFLTPPFPLSLSCLGKWWRRENWRW